MDARNSRWTFPDGASWDLSARARVVGILNVTPDSFSDGGRWATPETAVARGLEIAAQEADVIDIGGDSTRPGAEPVAPDVELARVVPVVRRLRERLDREKIRLSVDTTKSVVASAALDAGADIVNDVSGLAADPAMAPLIARRGASVILMHSRGSPQTMMTLARYEDLLPEIAAELGEALGRARAAGVPDDRIVLDPGIGFAKTSAQSLEVLARLRALAALGRPLLVGVSRKSVLGHATGLPVDQRLEASLAAGAVALVNGARLLRVHDVRETVRMVRTVEAILSSGSPAR